MFLNVKRVSITLFFILVGVGSVWAQIASSAYSSIGIGELSSPGFINTQSMGGVGYGYASSWYLNQKNPATLSENQFTTFEGGLKIDSRTLRENSTSQQLVSGGMSYIALGFPIIRNRWSTALSIQPLSRVNYNFQKEELLPNTISNSTRTYRGEGGLSKLSFSNGVHLWKGLSAGVKAEYIFGTITKNEELLLGQYLVGQDTVRGIYQTAYRQEDSYSDFTFQGGLYYTQKLGKSKFINFGLVYTPEQSIRTTRFGRLERHYPDGSTVEKGLDTIRANIIYDNLKGDTRLPSEFGGGVSFNIPNKIMVGVDASFSDWSSYESYGVRSPNYGSSYKMALGAEYTPDIFSVDRYLERVTYRAGFRYEQTPLVINQTKIKNFGIDFGLSLPISRVSSLNLGFEVGQKGTVQNNLVRENYYQIRLGFTYNDQWFLKRKYD